MPAQPDPYRSKRVDPLAPRLLPTTRDGELDESLRLRRGENPIPNATLGDLGTATRVAGAEHFAEAILVQPFDPRAARGVDLATVRGFRWNARAKRLVPVWQSGVNPGLNCVWTRIRQPGLYVAIGLPRDRLLYEVIRRVALERRLYDEDEHDRQRAINEALIGGWLEIPEEALPELRELLARVEIQTSPAGIAAPDVELGEGGHPKGFALPGGLNPNAFRERLKALEIPATGLPEEALFLPPVVPRNDEPPWDRPGPAGQWDGFDWRTYDHIELWGRIDASVVDRLIPPWLFSRDWWMYQHDVRHTGHASGTSDINALTVCGLYLHATVNVDGPVVTKPSIVGGKVYVGSGKSNGVGGTLYKIDLYSGAVEHTLPTSGTAFYSWVSGIGGSPAIVGGRVVFTGVHGTVYCIDAATFAPVWSVSLKVADRAHNQPVTNPNADSWSGPLVVNGRVYVGCGEGESATTHGFVFCLDAATGDVIWCFCTSKFTAAADNQPNQIPTAVAAAWANAHGFTVQANPPETGCGVWSSCAYDVVHDRIYVGTGNRSTRTPPSPTSSMAAAYSRSTLRPVPSRVFSSQPSTTAIGPATPTSTCPARPPSTGSAPSVWSRSAPRQARSSCSTPATSTRGEEPPELTGWGRQVTVAGRRGRGADQDERADAVGELERAQLRECPAG